MVSTPHSTLNSLGLASNSSVGANFQVSSLLGHTPNSKVKSTALGALEVLGNLQSLNTNEFSNIENMVNTQEEVHSSTSYISNASIALSQSSPLILGSFGNNSLDTTTRGNLDTHGDSERPNGP